MSRSRRLPSMEKALSQDPNLAHQFQVGMDYANAHPITKESYVDAMAGLITAMCSAHPMSAKETNYEDIRNKIKRELRAAHSTYKALGMDESELPDIPRD